MGNNKLKFNSGIRKECLFCHSWYIKGLGVQPQGGVGLPI